MTEYTMEALLELNESYHRDHVLTTKDLNLVNYLVGFIESSRDKVTPSVGDIIEITDQYGDYYKDGHIEHATGGELNICKVPYAPFVDVYGTRLNTNTSGGPWQNLKEKVEYIGKRNKRFKAWGHSGARANGAVYFEAEVSVWKYVAEGIEFSTQTHSKFFATFHDTPTDYGYIVTITQDSSAFTAFRTIEEYQAWLKTFCGVERDTHWATCKWVWTLKQDKKYVPLEEYLSISGAEIDTELDGAIQECKRVYKRTSVTTYLPYQQEKIVLPGSVEHVNARLQQVL